MKKQKRNISTSCSFILSETIIEREIVACNQLTRLLMPFLKLKIKETEAPNPMYKFHKLLCKVPKFKGNIGDISCP
jgi:hypothetical protein